MLICRTFINGGYYSSVNNSGSIVWCSRHEDRIRHNERFRPNWPLLDVKLEAPADKFIGKTIVISGIIQFHHQRLEGLKKKNISENAA
jgi:hypothetical protein